MVIAALVNGACGGNTSARRGGDELAVPTTGGTSSFEEVDPVDPGGATSVKPRPVGAAGADGGAPGLPTLEAGAPSAAPGSLPEGCSLVNPREATDECSIDLLCGDALRTVSCNRSSGCSCGVPIWSYPTLEVEVVGDISQLCWWGGQACARAPLHATDPNACQTRDIYVPGQYCERQRDCTGATHAPDGTEVELLERDGVYCNFTSEYLDCRCIDKRGNFEIGARRDGLRSEETPCASLLGACGSDPADQVGPWVCALERILAQGTRCVAEAQCRAEQPSASGVPWSWRIGYTPICERDEGVDQHWRCTCSGQGALELSAADDVSACELAFSACVEQFPFTSEP